MNVEPIQCPHCTLGTAVRFVALGEASFGRSEQMCAKSDGSGARYTIEYGHCQNPTCGRLIARLRKEAEGMSTSTRYVIPHSRARMALGDVPPEMAADYGQACDILDHSPPASAALARKCLQRVIRGHFGIKKDSLHDEIHEVIESERVPQYLADMLDRVREVGNLAAHPAQDRQTGLIVDVEKDEAEWTLEIVEGLFRYCFVEARRAERRTKSLEEKLGRARGPRPPA